MWSYQALIIFMVLLPGFVTRAIIESLTPRKKMIGLATVIESFIFSFFIYLVTLFVYPSSIQRLMSHTVNPEFELLLVDIRPLLLLTLSLAVFIGIGWSYLQNYDLLHRGLRSIRVTSSTSRSSTWLDTFFDMRGRHVIVTLEDGRRLMGYPVYYSHDQDEGCIFLSEPKWIDEKGNYIPCQLTGVLITKHEHVKRIEFMRHKIEFKEENNE